MKEFILLAKRSFNIMDSVQGETSKSEYLYGTTVAPL